MKKLTIILLLLLPVVFSEAQNLVPNPSFENYSTCPTTPGEIYLCQSWSSFGRSPDYFNACAVNNVTSVPYNYLGFQYAATGNAYCGFINASGGPAPPPEYLGAALLQPLVTGQKYFASFKISFPSIYCATNKMGICLSTVPFDSLNPPSLNNNAFIHTDSIFSDTTNWYQINGSFIADSNYTYIMIGNFYTNGSSCPAGTYVSYYYLEDVCLSTDSLTCYAPVGINELNHEQEIILFPNPASDFLNMPDDVSEGTTLSITDIHGKVFKTFLRDEINFKNQMDVSGLSKGIYFLKISNNNSFTVQKFIKQ